MEQETGSVNTANNNEPRVIAFIDFSNLRIGGSNYAKGNVRLSVRCLLHEFAKYGKLVEARIYDNYTKDHDEAFYAKYEEMGFTLKMKPATESLNNVQKEVDSEIVLDMTMNAIVGDTYDIAIVVSGDLDMAPAMDRVRGIGKKVIVMSFEDNLNRGLYNRADEVVLLDYVPIYRVFANGCEQEVTA